MVTETKNSQDLLSARKASGVIQFSLEGLRIRLSGRSEKNQTDWYKS